MILFTDILILFYLFISCYYYEFSKQPSRRCGPLCARLEIGKRRRKEEEEEPVPTPNIVARADDVSTSKMIKDNHNITYLYYYIIVVHWYNMVLWI